MSSWFSMSILIVMSRLAWSQSGPSLFTKIENRLVVGPTALPISPRGWVLPDGRFDRLAVCSIGHTPPQH